MILFPYIEISNIFPPFCPTFPEKNKLLQSIKKWVIVSLLWSSHSQYFWTHLNSHHFVISPSTRVISSPTLTTSFYHPQIVWSHLKLSPPCYFTLTSCYLIPNSHHFVISPSTRIISSPTLTTLLSHSHLVLSHPQLSPPSYLTLNPYYLIPNSRHLVISLFTPVILSPTCLTGSTFVINVALFIIKNNRHELARIA